MSDKQVKDDSVKGCVVSENFWQQHLCCLVFGVFLLLLLFYKFFTHCWIPLNPLPNDEEMIANFKANRADFEEIVRRYREYPGLLYPSEGKYWYEYDDTLELFRRAGIDEVESLAWQVWLPNPYSVQSALEVKRIVEQNDQRFPGLTLWQRYGALKLSPATTPLIEHPRQQDHRRHWRTTLRYGCVWKTYYFFPEEPRVEDGTLFWSAQTTYLGDPNGQYYEKEGVTIFNIKNRVLSSLNRFPDNWQQFDCVYRRIEPQWFIAMCRGR